MLNLWPKTDLQVINQKENVLLKYLAALWVSSDSPSSFTSSSKLTMSSKSGTNLEMTYKQ